MNACLALVCLARRAPALLMAGLLAAAPAAPAPVDPPATAGPSGSPKPAAPATPDKVAEAAGAPAPGGVEARFTDGSVLKLSLREDKITLVTDYGKLVVPAGDVLKIDFATRVPEEVAKKIQAAVAKLGADDFMERERAGAELVKIGARACPALETVAKGEDAEARRRAEEILAKIKESVPADQLEVRERDVLYTKDSKIAGRLEGVSWKVNSAQFGELQMRLADVRALHAEGFAERGAARTAALPDPGSLMTYAGKTGVRQVFTVTGRTDGSVWGTAVYTLDSSLATAAVHAGAVKVGETRDVEVEIVTPLPAFNGSTLNGVTSGPWGPFPSGAFQFVQAGK